VRDYNDEGIDTRKTTAGWRLLEKYAVRGGGGKNHRYDLGMVC
jgi:nicotinate-nucleotide pyrophosphorylase (carboxylating)